MNIAFWFASPVFLVLLKWSSLLALGWIADMVLRRGDARWRVILWRSILCFGLVLPALQFFDFPGIRIPISVHTGMAAEGGGPLLEDTTFNPDRNSADMPSNEVESRSSQSSSKPIPWQIVITAGWIFGFGCGILRLVRFHFQLSRLRKESCEANEGLRMETSRIQDRLNVPRELDVRISDAATSPFVCGLMKPTIILPQLLVEQLSPREMTALLSHEIAHLRRQDVVWCVLWQWLKAIWWFHPLVWKVPAAHNLACDQEADRIASEQLAGKETYAQLLARLALRLLALPAVETTLGLNGSSQIARRLKLLSEKGAGVWNWKYSVAGFGLAGSLFLLGAGYGFSESSSSPPPADQTSTVPAGDFKYPDTYGVYAYDGTASIPLSQQSFGRTTLPVTTSLIIYRKGYEDPVKCASSITVLDGRVLWERPPVWKGPPEKIDVEFKPIEGHPGMILAVPKKPWKPGLYWATFGEKEPSYIFGVETPDQEQYWNEVLAENPDNWQAHNHLGAMLYMQGDIKGAYPHFLRATQLNPTNPESHNNLGLALSYLGKKDEAIKEDETAVKLKDDAAMDTNLANAYLEAKLYDDAIKTYRHAIELDPTNASAHCNLGYALMQHGEVDDAIKEFQETIKIDPNMPQGQQDLKQALMMKARKAKAADGAPQLGGTNGN